MITFSISGLDAVRGRLESFNLDDLCFEIASALKAEIKNRVHVEGKASDGSQIGTYSKGYLVVRSGAYKDSKVGKSGRNTGKITSAGFHAKGSKKANKRKMYNRGTESNVILSLTRQMELDLDNTRPIPIEGGYGIGYRNDFNYMKAMWNQDRYGKPIWNLSEDEKKMAKDIVSNYVNETNR